MQQAASFGRVVLRGMQRVERAAQDDPSLRGSAKFDLLRKELPKIVDDMLFDKEIDQRAHGELHWALSISDRVTDMVETIISVSKSPEMVQLKEEAVKCIGKCKKRR